MNCITFRAAPASIIQRQIVIDEAANMATFSRRKGPVCLVYMTTILLALIFKHVDKCIPSSVKEKLSKAMVLDHVPDSKTFNMNSLVFANKLSACLTRLFA